MTDQNKSGDPFRNHSDEASSRRSVEAELDEVLERSAGFAAKLGREVGEPEPEEAQPRADDALGEVAHAPELDAQLNDLDRYLAETENAMGTAPHSRGSPSGDFWSRTQHSSDAVDQDDEDSAGESRTSPPDDAASRRTVPPSSNSHDPPPIPDFMLEFTTPVPGEAEKPSGGQKHPVPVYEEPATARAERANRSPKSCSEPTPPRPQGKARDSGETPGPSKAPPILTRLEALVVVATDHMVSVLELVDRPLRSVNPTTKRWVGLLALATLATAAIVYIASWL